VPTFRADEHLSGGGRAAAIPCLCGRCSSSSHGALFVLPCPFPCSRRHAADQQRRPVGCRPGPAHCYRQWPGRGLAARRHRGLYTGEARDRDGVARLGVDVPDLRESLGLEACPAGISRPRRACHAQTLSSPRKCGHGRWLSCGSASMYLTPCSSSRVSAGRDRGTSARPPPANTSRSPALGL